VPVEGACEQHHLLHEPHPAAAAAAVMHLQCHSWLLYLLLPRLQQQRQQH
jgi:hypothetical protein